MPKTLTAEEKLVKAKVNLTLNDRAVFYSMLVYKLEFVVDESIQTAATDGVRLFYNPGYIENCLTEEQVQTLLAHEAMHCTLGHIWRMGSRDQSRWNVAADHVINLDLTEAGFMPINGWYCDIQYTGTSAEQVYDLLPEDAGENHRPFGEIMPAPSDEHLPQIQAGWGVAVLNAAKAAQVAGYLPEFAKRLVEQIKKPKVDWRSVLRRFVQETAKADYSWRVPNKRYITSGIYLPGLRSEQMPPIVIGGDTSGSIDQETINRFGTEMQSIIDECNPERTYVMWWDTEVNQVDVFEQGEPLELNPVGGGGTEIADLFDKIERDDIQPSCLIILTDMCIFDLNRIEEPDYPVLWASTTEKVSAPFGEILYISE